MKRIKSMHSKRTKKKSLRKQKKNKREKNMRFKRVKNVRRMKRSKIKPRKNPTHKGGSRGKSDQFETLKRINNGLMSDLMDSNKKLEECFDNYNKSRSELIKITELHDKCQGELINIIDDSNKTGAKIARKGRDDCLKRLEDLEQNLTTWIFKNSYPPPPFIL